MYFRINVSLKGQHYFATAPESITDLETCKVIVKQLRETFLDSLGYKVTVTYVITASHNVEI
jgi:hypothetical protein